MEKVWILFVDINGYLEIAEVCQNEDGGLESNNKFSRRWDLCELYNTFKTSAFVI